MQNPGFRRLYKFPFFFAEPHKISWVYRELVLSKIVWYGIIQRFRSEMVFRYNPTCYGRIKRNDTNFRT